MSANLSRIPRRPAPLSSSRTLATWFCIAIATPVLTLPLCATAQAAETTAPNAKGGHSMEAMDHSDMDHDQMQNMDHDAMPDTKKPGDKKKTMKGVNDKSMDHDQMKDRDHDTMPEMKKPADKEDPMEGMDHNSMDHDAMPGMEKPGTKNDSTKGMGHSDMPEMKMPADKKGAMDMDMGSMQGGKAPPDARDPNAYADGLKPKTMHGMDMADDALFGRLLLDKFEYAHSKDGNAQVLDAQAWYGGDYNKLWLKADGERARGRLKDLRTEALWDHAIAPFWGLQLGGRHDFGEGPDRDWAAFGVQGLAPYWFDVEATAYLGPSGRTAARVELQYDILFTQRLILQPDMEFTLYGKSDPERGIGSGFSTLDLGLRLRYEIRRQFAPYVGVVFTQKYGQTADLARAANQGASEVRFVLGVRAWF